MLGEFVRSSLGTVGSLLGARWEAVLELVLFVVVGSCGRSRALGFASCGGQASIKFLEDFQEKHVCYGPLVAYGYMQGCIFTQERGWVEPTVDDATWTALVKDALEGMRLWLPRLGRAIAPRPGNGFPRRGSTGV